MSAETCLGVLIRLSMGELSLFDSVLESGRKISTKGSDCEQLGISISFSSVWVNTICYFSETQIDCVSHLFELLLKTKSNTIYFGKLKWMGDWMGNWMGLFLTSA